MKQILSLLFFVNNIFVFSQKMSILWEAKKDSTTIYLLGTNHLFPIDSILSKNKINNLITKADIFFLELDDNKKNMDSIFNLRPENNIRKKLGKKEYDIYNEYFKDRNYNNKLTAQEIAVQIGKKQISLSCKHNGLELMEDYFTNKITETNQPIITFEKTSDQLSQINNYYKDYESDMWKKNKEQLRYLKYYYSLGKGCRKNTTYTNDNYLFDFKNITNKKDKQVWDDRNIKWMKKLEKNITNKNYKNIFIMVGIGHLDYSNGLIMLLKNNGFDVKPIPTFE